MKKITVILTSVMLALIMAVIAPVHAFASAEGTSGKYISEVKVGYAKNADDAKAALDGYTILKDKNGNDVDVNDNAGGGSKTKGDMCVYIGYKTTSDPKDGVTDLAVMNMKGGYKVEDYKSLMDTQMKSQIIPFVDNFKAAIEEYRVNYSSDNSLNKAKAKYVHDCLNKLTDDDTGKNLGDLLLSQTKYEMGDDAYNALSDTEKKEHADILTIIAQANGKATVLMENLITRGADTSDDTWIERMSDTTYDDMIADTGLSPSKGKQQLDRQYYDDANNLLDMWGAFSQELLTYEDAVKTVDSYDQSAYEKAYSDMDSMNENTSKEEADKIVGAYNKAFEEYSNYLESVRLIAVYDYLKSISYDGGTLLDYFMTEQDDPTAVYPFVASLSEGQRAGLDFVSIRELVTVAMTDEQGYAEAETGNENPVSIYEDVDRGIYEPGGVALTSDAIRNDVTDVVLEYKSKGISGLTIAAYVLTGASLVGVVGSKVMDVIAKKTAAATAENLRRQIFSLEDEIYEIGNKMAAAKLSPSSLYHYDDLLFLQNSTQAELDSAKGLLAQTTKAPTMYNKLMIGCGVAMIIFAGISTYLTWRDLTAKYDIEFSPIPKYIVDEKDITALNSHGEKIVIKNQSAYYKVVETNRNEGDEWYDVLGTANDLGGGVGKQWLALYSVKNEAEDPILASSLLAVVNTGDLPAGYETGIHMFGTDAAANINSNLFVFNDDATETYVYFQRDEGAKADVTGTVTSGGYYALAGAAGLALGILGTVLVTKLRKKKEKNEG